MEIKIQCGCGTKYKFEVEPINGRMPTRVQCPSCAADGTTDANQILSQVIPYVPGPTAQLLTATAVRPAPAVRIATATAQAAQVPVPGLRIAGSAPAVTVAQPEL